jgi:hypothetical protein
MVEKYKIQTVNIREEQFEFIKELRKNRMFIFSKFVRDKLDEYIKFIRESKIYERVN